ncbi:hypothetical protein [Photobacterium sanguinicancri]|uniref:hypothetical protein n=1 Tax=Photobacterium sanguinicancri TaxID=875932 RepID=UPI0026E1C617|nr:hypothetical protein [Photobacterium sanguinicancri]MDO6497022.1 hypothetical protein [Photobacterium sanguinicancri]
MKDKEFVTWESIRVKGKLRFFFVNGLLSYGLPMCIITAYSNKLFENGFTLKAVLGHVTIWSMTGLMFGVVMWYITERRYKKEVTFRENSKQ